MSLSRVAEIATVLGYEPVFDLSPLVADDQQNMPPVASGVLVKTSTSTSSGAARISKLSAAA